MIIQGLRGLLAAGPRPDENVSRKDAKIGAKIAKKNLAEEQGPNRGASRMRGAQHSGGELDPVIEFSEQTRLSPVTDHLSELER